MSSTIHFLIDDETRRPEMQAVECEQAEERPTEDRRYQSGEHESWPEEQIAQAFSRHDAGEGEYISHDEMENRMNALKQRATRGSL